MGLYHIWFKSYEGFFYKITRKVETEISVFCVITLEPIKIQTCLIPQNDRLNLNFVKDIHVFAEKMTRSCLKTAICHSQILGNTLYYINNFVSVSSHELNGFS